MQGGVLDDGKNVRVGRNVLWKDPGLVHLGQIETHFCDCVQVIRDGLEVHFHVEVSAVRRSDDPAELAVLEK